MNQANFLEFYALDTVPLPDTLELPIEETLEILFSHDSIPVFLSLLTINHMYLFSLEKEEERELIWKVAKVDKGIKELLDLTTLSNIVKNSKNIFYAHTVFLENDKRISFYSQSL